MVIAMSNVGIAALAICPFIQVKSISNAVFFFFIHAEHSSFISFGLFHEHTSYVP